MVAVYNSFETAADGTTISTGNSGGGANTAFDGLTIGAGATAIFDASSAAGLSRSGTVGLLNAGATPTDVGVEWSTTVGSQTTFYVRAYYFCATHPVNQHRLLDITTAGGAALVAGIYHQAAGTICAADGTFGIACQGTVQLALNAWNRIEMRVVGNTTTGQIEMRQYNVPDANNWTERTSATALNTSGAGVIYRFGLHGDTYDTNRTIGLDDLGVSSVNWMGPAMWARQTIAGAARPTPGVIAQAVGRSVTW